MARLYADENVPQRLIVALRDLGHDVLTVYEAGQGHQRIPDPSVLAFAHLEGRAVLTYNRNDFVQLHKKGSLHSGIIVCTEDRDREALARRIDAAIRLFPSLVGELIRVYRPAK